MNLSIKGIRSLSLIDYPGHLASVIFLGGCNFRCPFCHNFELATAPERFPDLDPETILSELQRRRKLNDGVVITGGEPTLTPDLKGFCSKIKAMGYAVKLDTNGYRPEILSNLIQNQTVDFVSMDIKSRLTEESYSKAAGIPVNLAPILKSVEILMTGKTPYEFRTTVISPFVSKEDLLDIGKSLKGAAAYFLQAANPDHEHFKGLPEEELREIAEQLSFQGTPTFVR